MQSTHKIKMYIKFEFYNLILCLTPICFCRRPCFNKGFSELNVLSFYHQSYINWSIKLINLIIIHNKKKGDFFHSNFDHYRLWWSLFSFIHLFWFKNGELNLDRNERDIQMNGSRLDQANQVGCFFKKFFPSTSFNHLN